MESNDNEKMTLQRELAKAQAEILELRGQLDAQRNKFDFNRALERVKQREADDAAYKAEVEQRFAGSHDTISTTDF